MLRLLVTFLCALFLFLPSSYAANEEESACFDILNTKVNSLYGVNLASVYNGFATIDISTYSKFRAKREKTSSGSKIFSSQRNNIGTIVLDTNYIATQYVSLGNLTNFKFPINISGSLIGDEFKNFRNQMVYTHHNIFDGGSFLSCGYLDITPYPGYTYFDLDPSNYFTNILDGGGFEINDSYEVWLPGIGSGHYIVGKSVVQGATMISSSGSSTLDKLFKVNIVNVIYDNKSSYFNEYETFPLQVDAMTDADSFTTAWSLQQDFSSRVMNQTCLGFVHPNTGSLAGFCGGTYTGRSAIVRSDRGFASIYHNDAGSVIKKIIASIIPDVSARLSDEEVEEIQTKVAPTNLDGIGSTIQMDDNFDYFEYQKILSFPSEKLRDYTLLAVNSSYERDLQQRVRSGSTLTEYDKILLGCGFSYEDRVRLVKEWIRTIDIAKFSVENITYPDVKMGDCVIPFPDVRHKDEVIVGSFPSNQEYATYLKDLKSRTEEIQVNDLKKEMQELERQYAQKIQAANDITASGNVFLGRRMLDEARKEFEPKIESIQKRMYRILNPHIPLERNIPYIPTFVIIIGVILVITVMIFRRNAALHRHK